jgi:hypothetical protein
MTPRPGFREWLEKQPEPKWSILPLTHLTRGITAEDISRMGAVEPSHCTVFQEPRAYFFYGRPAYRLVEDGAVKIEASCPFCFIFDPAIIETAKAIYAFDTGAFSKRLYKSYLSDEMNAEDFSIPVREEMPNKLINAVFPNIGAYYEGDIGQARTPEDGAESWEFHARSYLHLIASRGRNEPDDRICSIEIVFGDRVPLAGNLKAVIVPHTLWMEGKRAPWLEKLGPSVEVRPYTFIPARHPEHYHAMLEASVRDLYKQWGLL